jgi:hypothetical protein
VMMPGHGQDGPRRLAETVARQSDLTYVPQVPIGRKPPSVQIGGTVRSPRLVGSHGQLAGTTAGQRRDR